MGTLILLIAICFAIFTAHYAFILFITDQAKLDRFFTIVPQNQYKMLTRNGAVIKILANVRGKYVDSETYKTEDSSGKKLKGLNYFLIRKYGVAWIGLPKSTQIFEYNFKWNKLVTENGLKLIAKEESVNSLYHSADYGIEIPNMELKGNFKARFVFKIRTETVNSFTSIWGILPSGEWLNKISSDFFGTIKEYASGKDFEDVKKEIVEYKANGSEGELAKMIYAITGDGSKYGQLIKEFDFLSFELESNPEAEKALQAKEMAELQGKANIEAAKQAKKVALIDAKKDLEVRTIEAQASYIEETKEADAAAYGVKKKYSAVKKQKGEQMFIAEQIKDSKLLSIGSNTLLNLTPSGENQDSEQKNQKSKKGGKK